MNGQQDYLGNPVAGSDAGALAAVDAFVRAMLAYDAGAPQVIKAAAGRPEHGLLNLCAGLLYMMLESPLGPIRALPFLANAQSSELGERERSTAEFLAAWIGGDLPRAEAIAEGHVGRWPRDLVLGKIAQYLAFNRGDAAHMLKLALAALPAAADVAEAHAGAAFGYEQCHLLADAELAARRALEMKPEPWAQHALAHVMLTEGRVDEGAAFMEAASGGWTNLNSFMSGHNWWHLCLFWLSQGRQAAVLEAYDAHCWAGDKDYSQDQVGAVSLLARAELAGIDVGDRWDEVADRIAARGLDLEQPFLALQYLYALARARRPEAAGFLEAVRAKAEAAPGFARPAWAKAALPAAEGITAELAGDHARAAEALGIALPNLWAVGGSHAQRDLFEQVWLAALVADGRWSEAQQALERRRAFDPDGAPLNLTLAGAYAALGLPAQAAAARARAEATLGRRLT
jgi:hypothetical protein